MTKVFNLVLPMDDNDLKPHPHFIVETLDNYCEAFKIVTFRPEKHLLPPYNWWFLKINLKCFNKPNCVSVGDIIKLENCNYLQSGLFDWGCKDETCEDFEKLLLVRNWQEISVEITLRREKIPKPFLRTKIFRRNDLIKFNH